MLPKEPTPVPQIIPLLEAVAATAGVQPWGVSSIESLGRLFLWETRPDVPSAIMDAIASEEGEVTEYRFIRRGQRIIAGVLIAVRDESEPLSLEALDEVAGRLRARYHIATGPDPRDGDDPF